MSKSICFPTDLPSRKNNNTEFPINETKHLCLLCKLKQSKWICVLHEKPNPQRDPIAATNLMQRLIQKICKEIQVLWWYGVLERCAKRERIKERKIKTKDGESIEVTCLLKQTLKHSGKNVPTWAQSILRKWKQWWFNRSETFSVPILQQCSSLLKHSADTRGHTFPVLMNFEVCHTRIEISSPQWWSSNSHKAIV